MKRSILLFITFSIILSNYLSAQNVNGLYVISDESLQKFYQMRSEGKLNFDLAGIQNVFLVYNHVCHPQLEDYYRYKYEDFHTVVAIFQFSANEMHQIFEDQATLSPGNLSETSINQRIITDSKMIMRFPTKPVTHYRDFSYDYDIYMQYNEKEIDSGRLYNFNLDNSNGIEYWEISFVKISDEIPEQLLSLVFKDYWLAESFDRLR